MLLFSHLSAFNRLSQREFHRAAAAVEGLEVVNAGILDRRKGLSLHRKENDGEPMATLWENAVSFLKIDVLFHIMSEYICIYIYIWIDIWIDNYSMSHNVHQMSIQNNSGHDRSWRRTHGTSSSQPDNQEVTDCARWIMNGWVKSMHFSNQIQ